MYSEIQSTSLDALAGRDGDLIVFCCLSDNKVFLGIRDGIFTCKVNSNGTVQSLAVLYLPSIEEIYNLYNISSDRLLMDAGTQVYIWECRKRRLHSLFNKRSYDRIKTFKEYIYVGKSSLKVEIYSQKGILVSSFVTKSCPYDVFINLEHIFVNELDEMIRIYSNDGYFSLVRTLKGQALHLDNLFLYCVTSDEISLISLTSLDMVSYGVFEGLHKVYSVLSLGNEILVRTLYNLYLFDFKTLVNDCQLKQIWKSVEREHWPITDGLLVLSARDAIQYVVLEVQPRKLITIRI